MGLEPRDDLLGVHPQLDHLQRHAPPHRLGRLRDLDHAFWPDDLPFAEAVVFTGARLVGHQQVTDAYLLGLALRRGGVLATLDERIAALTELKSPER